jgi:hypothetical protein
MVALLGMTGLALAGKGVSFREFPAGDTVTVTYQSNGCFSNLAYEFDFQRAAMVTAEIFRLEPQRDPVRNIDLEPKRVSLGTVVVTDAELAGLDRLLGFYRGKPGGGCTTVDTIVVTQKTGKELKASEAFVDASCLAGDTKDVTLFYSLVAKLKLDE